MTSNKNEQLLPPRPGEIKKPVQGENKNVPIIVYINGQPVTMAKDEALGVIAQIAQIMLYLESNQEAEETKPNGIGN
jgi:hypothetical protein